MTPAALLLFRKERSSADWAHERVQRLVTMRQIPVAVTVAGTRHPPPKVGLAPWRGINGIPKAVGAKFLSLFRSAGRAVSGGP